MQLVKLVVIGAPGVGKTSIIEHFLDDKRSLFDRAPDNVYSVSLVAHEAIFQLKILDMPTISYFPSSAYSEWSEFRDCGLRSAHGYIMVFSLTDLGTFQYLKVIRDQLFESRNMQNIPVYVLGNKADLCSNVLSLIRSGPHSHHHHPHQLHTHHHHHEHDLNPALKDLAQLVRKQWKASYLECSAKYNWRIVPVFKELFRNIELSQKALAEQSAHHHKVDKSDHEHHRESLKSWAHPNLMSTAPRAIAPSRTSNHNERDGRRIAACHLL